MSRLSVAGTDEVGDTVKVESEHTNQTHEACINKYQHNTKPRYAVLFRRFADRLQFLRRNIKGSTNHRGHAPHRGTRPCATQGLLRYSLTDPVRPSRLHHLQHWQRSPTGSREEMFCATASSTRTALRNSQESSPGRLRPSVSLRECRHFMSVSGSITQ